MKKLFIVLFLLVSCGDGHEKIQGIQGKKGDKGDQGQQGINGKDGEIPKIPTDPREPTPLPTGYPRPMPAPSEDCNGKPCGSNANSTTVIISGPWGDIVPVNPPPQDTFLVCACIPMGGHSFGCANKPRPPCIYTTLRIRAKDINGYNYAYKGACR